MGQNPDKDPSLKASEQVLSLEVQIKKMKNIEQALRESEERFRTMANAIPQLAWIANADGYIYWYNDRWYEYTGTTYKEMEGWGWQNVHDPEELPRVLDRWTSSIATGEFFDMVFPLKGKDGKFRQFLTRVTPLKNNEGQVTQWFGTNTDITEQKQVEEKLRESHEKLLEAQSMAHMCSFIFDFEKNSFEWTEEFLNIFEIDSQSEYPSLEKLYELVHPEDKQYVLETVKQAVENKIEALQMEYRIVTGKGNVKYVSYRGKLTYNENGQVTKRFGTIMDVTERKFQELELRKTLANLERSNKDLEQFAYVASHDLQEPLRMVSIYSTMLERNLQGTLDDKTRQYLKILIESSKRMHSLITGLLEYSRISSITEEPIHVDMNNLVKEVLKNLSFLIKETDTEVKVENLTDVKANPVQIKLLIQNLISNAIKFTEKGVKPCIEIKGEKKDKSVVYSVKDNGIGISLQDHERIFVLFHRLHAREVYAGTGIGLSLCKRIVENQGGGIWVESEAGKGSTFYFSLPD